MRIETAGREFAGIAGFAAVGFGLWHVWWPLCPIVLGSLVLAASAIGHLRAPGRKPPLTAEPPDAA